MSDEELISEFEEIVVPPKKRSKFKILLLLTFIAFLALAALYALNRMGYVDIPLDKYIQVEKLFEGSLDTIKVESEEDSMSKTLPPSPQMPAKPKTYKESIKQKTIGTKGGYYLKVGSCLYSACQKDIQKKIKRFNLPLVTSTSVQTTTYYTLISDASFLKKRAEEKLGLINRYNKTNGFPFLQPSKKKRYKISFGQFPQKPNAIRMKSQLEHLYPQIRMRFTIQPKKDRVTITKLYVGPYSKTAAEKTRNRLRMDPDFEWIEITRQH